MFARPMPLASTVGVALFDMREGEPISWGTRYGDICWLRVVKVIGRD